ncbi:hypothetical protein ACIBL3_18800 [Kribbella sp. NPDC050124]|uniref:hypothetical protein n=1 Tax=Kribbella sp. NPDC050124 TaxID=3364114 RepID=UPI0037A4AF88
MTDQVPPEAAALVIRVWRDLADSGIRARITRQADLARDEQTSVVVASPDDVYQEVRAWLERFIEQSRRG